MKHKQGVFTKWNGNLKKFKCSNCGHTWESRYRTDYCPYCKTTLSSVDRKGSYKYSHSKKKKEKKYGQGFGVQYDDLSGKKEICKKCHLGYMKIRYNHKDGNAFMGCSRYPECTYTEEIKIK